jgi:hypothetical protein
VNPLESLTGGTRKMLVEKLAENNPELLASLPGLINELLKTEEATQTRAQGIETLFRLVINLATFTTGEPTLALRPGETISLPPVPTAWLIEKNLIKNPSKTQQINLANSSRKKRGEPPMSNYLEISSLQASTNEQALSFLLKETFTRPFFPENKRSPICLEVDIQNFFSLPNSAKLSLERQLLDPYVHVLVAGKWYRLNANNAEKFQLPPQIESLFAEENLPREATNQELAILLSFFTFSLKPRIAKAAHL